MHRRCQDRIRSYLYKTIDQIKSSEVYCKNESARRHLTNLIAYFKLQLREDHCMGYYFDRSCSKFYKKKLEDNDESDGIFTCNYDHCPCKLNSTSSSYTSERMLEIYFNNECDESDEIDARKIKYDGNIKTDDDPRGDRSSYKIIVNNDKLKSPICDERGEFHCEGVWSSERCAYGERHCINPYRSYEELVLFSTWNFDHR